MSDWVTPRYSKGSVDRAGRSLANDELDREARDEALAVLNNWRASHSYPLNTFQMTLRHKSKRVYQHRLVAQRLKRTPSILRKLRRFERMRLSRMQDIGGCRAVVLTTRQVRTLREAYRAARFDHELVNEKNYIETPKPSGYRGVHLVYRYRHSGRPDYDGLQIEVQLRSRVQHAWATAVETVGTFLQESLKSSEGPDRWLDFFALCGSAFALSEGEPLVPGQPTDHREIIELLGEKAHDLDVRTVLRAYGAALKATQEPDLRDSKYYLLALRPNESRLTVSGFSARELEAATEEYLRVEKELAPVPRAEVVLVSTQSLSALRRAYPNYFLDTRVFVDQLEEVLRRP